MILGSAARLVTEAKCGRPAEEKFVCVCVSPGNVLLCSDFNFDLSMLGNLLDARKTLYYWSKETFRLECSAFLWPQCWIVCRAVNARSLPRLPRLQDQLKYHCTVLLPSFYHLEIIPPLPRYAHSTPLSARQYNTRTQTPTHTLT